MSAASSDESSSSSSAAAAAVAGTPATPDAAVADDCALSSNESSSSSAAASSAAECDAVSLQLVRSARNCCQQLHANSGGGVAGGEYWARAVAALTALADLHEQMATRVALVRQEAPRFDFDDATPANGYRSLLYVYGQLAERAGCTCQQLAQCRWVGGGGGRRWRNAVAAGGGGTYGRSAEARELVLDAEAWCQWTASLGVMFEHMETLLNWSYGDCVFPDDRHSPIDLLKRADEVSQYCFYGRMMGFQFDPTIQPVLQRIVRFMCMYSHYFYNTGSSFRRWATASIFFRRIMNDSDYRAKRVVNISRYADIDFCKGFWSQQEGEFIQMFPEVAGPALAVNVRLGLPPVKLVLPRVNRPAADGGDDSGGGGGGADDSGHVTVMPVTVHIGLDSIQCRLLSSRRRAGMVGGGGSGKGGRGRMAGAIPALGASAVAEPSPCLVFHCHGGGFVAQSSKSHEVYLRQWACQLDVPIFSVDYSLAPKAPFPRACEEVFYAYCWALRHCRLLGSSGERVLVVGDSAGGNLVCTVTLEALRRGVRAPDAQLLIYTPFNVTFVPSPARLLCLTDPLLPLGFLMRCLHAYAGHSRHTTTSTLADSADQPSPAAAAATTDANAATAAGATAAAGAAAGGGASPANAAGSGSVDTDGDPAAAASTGQDYAAYTLNPKRHRLGHRLANRDLDTLAADPLVTEFQCFAIAPDARLSPYLCEDSLLARCPRTHVLSCHLDPCLDDCVAMARRWRRLAVPVQLTVLTGVCHGFLNFARFSEAAERGNRRCIDILSALIRDEPVPNSD